MRYPCQGCQDYHDGWLDHREPYTKWIQFGSIKSSVESYHQKAQERRDLVRRQLELKEDSCRAKGCLPAQREAA